MHEIDRVNILRAALLAMARAVDVLGIRPDVALVDGSIVASADCTVMPAASRASRTYSTSAG